MDHFEDQTVAEDNIAGQQKRQPAVEAMADYEGPVEAFLPAVLDSLAGAVPASESAVFSTRSDGSPELLVCHPAKPGEHPDAGAWLKRVHQHIEQRSEPVAGCTPLYNNTGQQVWAQLAIAPLVDPNASGVWGVICLIVRSGDSSAGREALLNLQLAAQVIAGYQLRRVLQQKQSDLLVVSQAAQALDAINRESRFKPAAIALCNQTADMLRASRVSVGFMSGQNIKLCAMSHTEDLIRKMKLVQDLEAAMEECVDQDSEVLVPNPDHATTINRQAKLYVERHGPSALCVLPLRLHQEVVGAVAVEWPSDHAITTSEVETVRLSANLWTARLHQFYLDDRWFGARLATSVKNTAGVLVGPKHTWAKLLAIAIAAFLAFMFLAKGDNTVDSAFTVQTKQRQVITAPFAGTLQSVAEGIDVNEFVIGTDRPEEPQGPTMLARMDTSELRVERASVLAQIADYQAQADAARGENDLAGVEVAMANIRRLEAEAALYDYRIERSTLISPTSGVIIEGDLRQRVNGSLDKGEVLFEIAPLDALRAELLVPASRIGDVRARLEHPDNPSRGELASASHPGDFIGFTVERIEPEAEVVDGANVFRVRVSLDKTTDWLRPGVEGEASIHVDRRSYAYLWTRDAVNWVRMKLWM